MTLIERMQADIDEIDRLRAANATMLEALRDLLPDVDALADAVAFGRKPDLDNVGFVMKMHRARAAIEQATA